MTYAEFIDFNKHTDQGEYTHKHHIIPVGVGGKNTKDNKVELSWLTHYYAHLLLAKENPDSIELQRAFKRMGSIDAYLKKAYRDSLLKGENHPCWGKPRPDEAKKKTSATMKGHTMSEESRKKLSEAKMGKPMSAEARKAMSEAAKRRWARERAMNSD